jgi:hypothetical protein
MWVLVLVVVVVVVVVVVLTWVWVWVLLCFFSCLISLPLWSEHNTDGCLRGTCTALSLPRKHEVRVCFVPTRPPCLSSVSLCLILVCTSVFASAYLSNHVCLSIRVICLVLSFVCLVAAYTVPLHLGIPRGSGQVLTCLVTRMSSGVLVFISRHSYESPTL